MPFTKVSRWIPISDPKTVAVIGKLQEELGELIVALSRTLIQGGLDKTEPTTSKTNKAWVQEEVADVHAMLALLVDHCDLDAKFIARRAEMKLHYKKHWLRMIDAALEVE